jgi:DNA mismatch endonuclease, patch repair protein
MDIMSKRERSRRMSLIRSTNTSPEIKLRRYIRKKGLKGFRIKSSLPGKPDLYFPKYKIAVFVDGCFWHKCPRDFRKPKSKSLYWNKKIGSNVIRDIKTNDLLFRLGIKVLRAWEHEIEEKIEVIYKKIQNSIS